MSPSTSKVSTKKSAPKVVSCRGKSKKEQDAKIAAANAQKKIIIKIKIPPRPGNKKEVQFALGDKTNILPTDPVTPPPAHQTPPPMKPSEALSPASYKAYLLDKAVNVSPRPAYVELRGRPASLLTPPGRVALWPDAMPLPLCNSLETRFLASLSGINTEKGAGQSTAAAPTGETSGTGILSRFISSAGCATTDVNRTPSPVSVPFQKLFTHARLTTEVASLLDLRFLIHESSKQSTKQSGGEMCRRSVVIFLAVCIAYYGGSADLRTIRQFARDIKFDVNERSLKQSLCVLPFEGAKRQTPPALHQDRYFDWEESVFSYSIDSGVGPSNLPAVYEWVKEQSAMAAAHSRL